MWCPQWPPNYKQNLTGSPALLEKYLKHLTICWQICGMTQINHQYHQVCLQRSQHAVERTKMPGIISWNKLSRGDHLEKKMFLELLHHHAEEMFLIQHEELKGAVMQFDTGGQESI